MNTLHFRVLVVVVMLFSIIGGCIDLIMPIGLVEDISIYADSLQPKMDSNAFAVFVIIATPTIICMVGGFIGLLMLKSWGRTLYISSFIVGLPLYYSAGVSVVSPLAQVLCDIGAYGEGFILALCYFSTLNMHFKKQI